MGVKPSIGIIGAGAGGIAMGIQLAEGGYDFTIFDRADGFGGTWPSLSRMKTATA